MNSFDTAKPETHAQCQRYHSYTNKSYLVWNGPKDRVTTQKVPVPFHCVSSPWSFFLFIILTPMLLPIFFQCFKYWITLVPEVFQGVSPNCFHPLAVSYVPGKSENENQTNKQTIKIPCRCHGENVAKRNHRTFHLRSDATHYNSSLFSSVPLRWCLIAPCYFC